MRNNFLMKTLTSASLFFLGVPFALAVPFSPYADITLSTHWDNSVNDLAPMDFAKVAKQAQVKHIHFAFITDAGTCMPAWGGQSAYSVKGKWGSAMMANLRANNMGYTVSLGGANGNDLSAACNKDQLVDAYENIISIFQPDSLDFDIENGTADVSRVMQALKVVQEKHPKIALSFTLPVMPEGLTYSGQDIVKQASDANLQFTVNIMAMDYGPSYVTKTMGEYAVDAATNLSTYLKTIYPKKSEAQIWKMIEVTPMIGVNDVNVEKFTLRDADFLKKFADMNGLGGVSMWSLNRDLPCSDKWTSPTCSGENLQTKPYEFSMHFSGQ